MTETATADSSAVQGRVYEAMFLISQHEAASLGSAVEHIEEIINRSGGEIVAMRKWDERRLAYEIEKQKRGCYILAFVRGPGSCVAEIERLVNISERIMRVLVLRADHLTEEEIATHDDRSGLITEARAREERRGAEESKTSGVKLGAPDREQAGAAEAPPQPEQAAEEPAETPAAETAPAETAPDETERGEAPPT